MHKPTFRTLVAALALLLPSLFAFATSSALGARGLRHETKRAAHPHRAHHVGVHASHQSGRSPASVNQTTTTSTVLLGDEAVEPNRAGLSGGQAEAFPFPARASGTAGAVHVYLDFSNTATALLVGLYTNAGGRPGSLLSEASLSAPPAGAWDTAPLAPTQLVSGTTYWLAVLGTGGTLRFRDGTHWFYNRAHGSCTALTSAQTTLDTLPAAWSAGAARWTCPVSGYLTAAAASFPVEPPAPVEIAPPPRRPSKRRRPPKKPLPRSKPLPRPRSKRLPRRPPSKPLRHPQSKRLPRRLRSKRLRRPQSKRLPRRLRSKRLRRPRPPPQTVPCRRSQAPPKKAGN